MLMKNKRELEAIKNTYYTEDNKIYFIFPDEPDQRDWQEAKQYYKQNKKCDVFYKVLTPQWKS